jgi:cation:H+ antiporter
MTALPSALLLLILITGIGGLVWTADRFVAGAAAIAEDMGVSALVIGLTVVSIGTSAPEILVSVAAAMHQTPSLAVGNALGSNLANIGLVLAVSCLLFPIQVHKRVVMREISIMILITLAAGAVLYDGYLSRGESVFLLGCLVVFIWSTLKFGARGEPLIEAETTVEEHMPLRRAIAITAASLLGLLLFANILVESASELALRMGISEMLIGMTVVAVGTSLPELAASIASCRIGKTDMAIGNVVGSNIFNLLAVLPVAGVIHPSLIERGDLLRDYGFVLTISLLLGALCLGSVTMGRQCSLGRLSGGIFLAIYGLYYYQVFG